MDTARLVTIINKLITEEDRLEIQNRLQGVLNSLVNLAANPADPGTQLNATQALETLKNAVGQFTYESDPTFSTYVKALNGEKFFSTSLVTEISQAMLNNSMTPAVVRDLVQGILTDRQTFIEYLRTFSSAARGLNISADKVQAGESQIGFRIPREIFRNELKGWTAELDELRSIIRPFSELATGGAEPIEIGEISTTDPIIFLLLNPVTVAMIAKAVSWSLDQWKKIEEIRKLRAETAKISGNTDGAFDDMVAQYDEKIKGVLLKAIEEHANSLVPNKNGAGRHHELITDLTHALQSLVARIERGMTIELKFLPAAASEAGSAELNSTINEIKDIVPQLTFPSPSQTPVIALPSRVAAEAAPQKTGNKTKN
jgi:hypothetical protein